MLWQLIIKVCWRVLYSSFTPPGIDSCTTILLASTFSVWFYTDWTEQAPRTSRMVTSCQFVPGGIIEELIRVVRKDALELFMGMRVLVKAGYAQSLTLQRWLNYKSHAWETWSGLNISIRTCPYSATLFFPYKHLQLCMAVFYRMWRKFLLTFFNLVEFNILFIVCVLILIKLCYVQANYLHYFIFFKEKYSTFLEDD